MADREKVIKGLQNLRDAIAFDYIRETDHAVETLDNAIAMLKEQDAVKPEWKNGSPFCGNCGHRLEKKNRNTDGIKCPECGRSVKWE